MPHFIIECSENILNLRDPQKTMKAVHDTAEESGLFKSDDIKVRLNPYTYYTNNHSKKDFIHVFGNIMEGRTSAQKTDLSKKIISKLSGLFPRVPVISMNITEFEKASYCNRNML
jgi:5-carboxymethyl-2-hydroxymuconate isomerase